MAGAGQGISIGSEGNLVGCFLGGKGGEEESNPTSRPLDTRSKSLDFPINYRRRVRKDESFCIVFSPRRGFFFGVRWW